MSEYFRVSLKNVAYNYEIGTSPTAQKAIKNNNKYQESGNYKHLRKSLDYLHSIVLNDPHIGNKLAACIACNGLADRYLLNPVFNHYQRFFIANSVTSIIMKTGSENTAFKKSYLYWLKVRNTYVEEIQKNGVDPAAAAEAGIELIKV